MNILTRLWQHLFGPPQPKEVWKTTKSEFLRYETRYVEDPSWPIDTFAVWAEHQISLTTQKTRVIEAWRLT